MSAVCAACLRPITKATQFVLSGTEAFHRACAVHIERSRGSRQAQRILELERLVEVTQRGMDDTRRVCEGYVTRAEHAVAGAKAEVAAAQRAQGSAENAAAVAKRAVRELTTSLGAMSQALEQAQRERDAARSEAALHQQLGSAPAKAATAGEERQGDDAVQRFAMLELD
jgi:chromosome segregation ATPase